jgi:hypothetical protein
MKKAKVIILALLFTAGGLVGAAAQGAVPDYYGAAGQGAGPYFFKAGALDYPLHERIIAAPRFAYTAGLPVLTSVEMESLSGGVFTDGSGRIAGQVYARVYLGGAFNHVTDYGVFAVTVTGTTGDRGTNPLVKITMRGNGYTFDGVSNHANASLNLKFVSTNSLEDVPARQVQITNSNYSVTYADGSTQAFTDGPATKTNSGFTFLTGTMKGNIKRGKNGGSQLNINEAGSLVSDGSIWTVVNGTNFVEHLLSGGLVLDAFTNIDAQVIQPLPGSKLWLNANVGSFMALHAGTGSANTNTLKWNASFNGVAYARGSRFQANGNLGPVIIGYDPIPNSTNFLPRLVLKGIQDMTITSGKIFGQKISKDLQGISLSATPP